MKMKPVMIFKITRWDRKTILLYAMYTKTLMPAIRSKPTFGEFGTLLYEELIFKDGPNAIINKPPIDLQKVNGKFYPCEPLSEQELQDIFDRYGK